MNSPFHEIVQFEVDAQAYGLPAAQVEEVLPAIAPARLPRTPSIVEGVINLRGAIVPVLDLRARFRLQAKVTDVGDLMIVARAGGRRVAIRADRVIGLVELKPGDIHAAKTIFPTENHIAQIATGPEGVVLLHDLAHFLSRAESELLDGALAQAEAAP